MYGTDAMVRIETERNLFRKGVIEWSSYLDMLWSLY